MEIIRQKKDLPLTIYKIKKKILKVESVLNVQY